MPSWSEGLTERSTDRRVERSHAFFWRHSLVGGITCYRLIHAVTVRLVDTPDTNRTLSIFERAA